MRVLAASLFAAATLILAHPAYAQIDSVTLMPPARDFGYLVGDQLTAQAVIGVADGTELDARTLPSPGPVSALLDIRSVRVSKADRFVTVTVTYQSFVSPEQVQVAEVPGYAMEFVVHGMRLTAHVPGFGFSVSPFRHDLQPVIDPAVLKPTHLPRLPDLSGAWRTLIWSGVTAMLAAGVLVAGAGRDALAGQRRAPFAAAARRIGRQPGGAAPQPDHLLALHRAFDATAGQRVFAEDLAAFFARHPHFTSLRADVEAFFAASRATFFGGDAGDAPELTGLSRALARAERRA